MNNILMIEDNSEFAEFLGEYLAKFNIKITNYEDPYLGLSCGVEKYELLILDLSLPGMDGLEVCKRVRSSCNIPIIVSSARSDITDKVTALEIGADDYLPKPYDPKEMVARIKSLLRRYNIEPKEKEKMFIVKNEVVFFNNEALDLTLAEFEILQELIRNDGSSVSREQLVFGSSSLGDESSSKSLDVIINRIRKKINDNERKVLKTIRNVGYKLVS